VALSSIFSPRESQVSSFPSTPPLIWRISGLYFAFPDPFVGRVELLYICFFSLSRMHTVAGVCGRRGGFSILCIQQLAEARSKKLSLFVGIVAVFCDEKSLCRAADKFTLVLQTLNIAWVMKMLQAICNYS